MSAATSPLEAGAADGVVAAGDGSSQEGRSHDGRSADARRYVRGSGLLLGGRAIALVTNLLTQVVIVRYLSQGEYGAVAYALTVASMGTSIALAGMDKTLPRFVSIYQEHREPAKVLGTVLLACAAVAVVGIGIALGIVGMRDTLLATLVKDDLARGLLLLIILLAPIDAVDNLLQQLLASFIGARPVFWRRYVLAPGLKLLAALAVVATTGDVRHLAVALVVAGTVGVVAFVPVLLRQWRRDGLLAHARRAIREVPVRAVLSYNSPLVLSELSRLARGAVAVVLLEYLHSTVAVAEFRAVLPVAKLNLVAMESFGLLFIPLAARMFARNDRDGLNDLYWQSAVWMTVLAFPVALVTIGLSGPVTVQLFGAAYASSAPILAILSIGFFVNATLGFNVYTLRVHGRMRRLLLADLAATLLGLMAIVVLIPRHGALGAAIGTSLGFIAHAVLAQAGLICADTGVRLVDLRFVRVYVAVVALLASLLVLQWMLAPPWYVSLLAATAAALAVIRGTRRIVHVTHVFPELVRVPLMSRLLA